ncbi:hypothetical protein SAMN05216184_11954, partial [Georgenia satyanarayanai]
RNTTAFDAVTNVLDRHSTGLDAIDNILGRNTTAFASIAEHLTRGLATPTVLPGYQDAARRVLKRLDTDVEEDDLVPFTPSKDDSAYEMLAGAAPEIASAIDDAVKVVKTSFWSRRVVRNSLAWLVISLLVTVWVASGFLPAPLGSLLGGLYGTGQAVLQVKKRLGPPPKSSSHDDVAPTTLDTDTPSDQD